MPHPLSQTHITFLQLNKTRRREASAVQRLTSTFVTHSNCLDLRCRRIHVTPQLFSDSSCHLAQPRGTSLQINDVLARNFSICAITNYTSAQSIRFSRTLPCRLSQAQQMPLDPMPVHGFFEELHVRYACSEYKAGQDDISHTHLLGWRVHIGCPSLVPGISPFATRTPDAHYMITTQSSTKPTLYTLAHMKTVQTKMLTRREICTYENSNI